MSFQIVSIEGNIGCGKSTLIKYLSSCSKFKCIPEPVKDWSLLGDFYNDMRKYALTLQLQIMFSYLSIYNKRKCETRIITERSLWSSRNVFAQMLHSKEFISSREMAIYTECLEKSNFKYPDAIIYVRTNPSVAFSRLSSRNTDCDKQITLTYIEELHNIHEKAIADFKGKVIIIDGNASQEEVQQQLNQIEFLFK